MKLSFWTLFLLALLCLGFGNPPVPFLHEAEELDVNVVDNSEHIVYEPDLEELLQGKRRLEDVRFFRDDIFWVKKKDGTVLWRYAEKVDSDLWKSILQDKGVYQKKSDDTKLAFVHWVPWGGCYWGLQIEQTERVKGGIVKDIIRSKAICLDIDGKVLWKKTSALGDFIGIFGSGRDVLALGGEKKRKGEAKGAKTPFVSFVDARTGHEILHLDGWDGLLVGQKFQLSRNGRFAYFFGEKHGKKQAVLVDLQQRRYRVTGDICTDVPAVSDNGMFLVNGNWTPDSQFTVFNFNGSIHWSLPKKVIMEKFPMPFLSKDGKYAIQIIRQEDGQGQVQLFDTSTGLLTKSYTANISLSDMANGGLNDLGFNWADRFLLGSYFNRTLSIEEILAVNTKTDSLEMIKMPSRADTRALLWDIEGDKLTVRTRYSNPSVFVFDGIEMKSYSPSSTR